jgi:hypothetical protein
MRTLERFAPLQTAPSDLSELSEPSEYLVGC